MAFDCPECGGDTRVKNSGSNRGLIGLDRLPAILREQYAYLPRLRICSECGFRFHTLETELMAWVEHNEKLNAVTQDEVLRSLDKLVSSSSSWEDLVLAFSSSRRGGRSSR